MFDLDLEQLHAMTVARDLVVDLLLRGVVFLGEKSHLFQHLVSVFDPLRPAERDDGRRIPRPIALFAEIVARRGKAHLVASGDRVRLMPLGGAVDVYAPVLIDEVDGHAIGVAAVADDGEHSALCLAKAPFRTLRGAKP